MNGVANATCPCTIFDVHNGTLVLEVSLLARNDVLCPKEDEVAAKVMDGEAILINLSTGTYYSMDGPGGLIWETIERRPSIEEIVAVIYTRYDVEPSRAEADVQHVVAQLLEEGLIGISGSGSSRSEFQSPSPQSPKQAYTTPKLNIYRDMAQLLALDPPTPGGAQEMLWREPDDAA